MKKRINIRKCFMIGIVLLFCHAGSYAQKSLINEQWQRRITEISFELKKEWAESLKESNWTKSRGVDLTPEDLLNAIYIPVAHFVLNYDSFQKLTTESNLEFLLKLDTTRVDYIVFNKRTNKYVVSVFGRFWNGRWEESGFGVWNQNSLDFFAQFFAKNISLYKLRVFLSPDQVWDHVREYSIFIENGQLMCRRQGMLEPQPLLKTLLELKEREEGMKKAIEAVGTNFLTIPF